VAGAGLAAGWRLAGSRHFPAMNWLGGLGWLGRGWHQPVSSRLADWLGHGWHQPVSSRLADWQASAG